MSIRRGPSSILSMARTSLVLSCMALPAPAFADQEDERLPSLFVTLRAADSAEDAAPIEHRIWQIWLESRDREVADLIRRGTAVMTEGDEEEALRHFNLAIEQAPEHAEAWNKRATVLYVLGRYQESIRDIKRTLLLEPRHFGALSGLALIYEALDQPQAALLSLEAAVKIHPHLPGAKDRLLALREKRHGQET